MTKTPILPTKRIKTETCKREKKVENKQKKE